MQEIDRAAFGKLAEALFAAFDKPASDARLEAYWRGLQSMHLLAFERVVDHVVGPDGEEDLPTPRQCHQISRSLVAEQRRNERPHTAPAPAKELDVYELYANRVLMRLLRELAHAHGSSATPESLAKMLHVKQIFVDGYRSMCATEPETSLELRDVLIEKLTPLFVPSAPRLSSPAPERDTQHSWAAP